MIETSSRIGRIRWRSRRGMKELDVMFDAYFKSDLSACNDETLGLLERLLDCQDPDLLEWMLGHSAPEDEQLGRAIELIRQA
jgi:antitoxin CptB